MYVYTHGYTHDISKASKGKGPAGAAGPDGRRTDLDGQTRTDRRTDRLTDGQMWPETDGHLLALE